MGGGTWESDDFTSYTRSKGMGFDSSGSVDTSYMNTRDMYKSIALDPELSPKNIMRECCDSKEHPETIPVSLCLDVTGSMGDSAMKVAASLNNIMKDLYKDVKDIEFQFQAFGDLEYDDCPEQITQFESDIRIAKQLDKVYFEGHGGGNAYESYTLPWYMAAFHSKLDCWNRGKKGILITLGDEPLNPILFQHPLERLTGDTLQGDINTDALYAIVADKYDVYHIFVDHSSWANGYYKKKARKTFCKYLPTDHYFEATLDEIPKIISGIIVDSADSLAQTPEITSEEISW